jgi:lipoprotein-anchoring transpeptidase ErfK/SrfK
MRNPALGLLWSVALCFGSSELPGEPRAPFGPRKETVESRAGTSGKTKPFAKRVPAGGTSVRLPKPGHGQVKRVEINLTEQRLRAYEGRRLVLNTNISSGRNRATPTGRFKAGYKDADHYSSLYHNAPMPWSVQVSGNIFIHGFSSVPDYPASHGCIRLPLTGRNPAKRFFEWVEAGTPILISY